MRPTDRPQSTRGSNAPWSPWELFGIIVAAIVVGNIVWWWSASIYAEHKLGEAAQALAQEAKEAEKKQREVYYQEMTRQELAAQRQEAENVRIAWENYNQVQKAQEEQNKRNFVITQQRQWEKGNNPLPVIDFNTKNTREIAFRNDKSFDPVKDKAEEECRSWKNSYVLEPTSEKKKYIQDNCS